MALRYSFSNTGIHEYMEPDDRTTSAHLAVLSNQMTSLMANVEKLNESFDKLVRMEERQLQANKRLDKMEARCVDAEKELETWRRWRVILTPVALAMSAGVGGVAWKVFTTGIGG